MAQDKTEKATPQKRRRARQEGQVARSQEIGVLASLLAAFLVLRLITPTTAHMAVTEARALLGGLDRFDTPNGEIGMAALRAIIAVVGPFMVVGLVIGVAAGVAQVGVKLTPKAARPKLSNLSPKKGLEKFKPAVAGWELARSVLKIGLLLAVVWPTLANLPEQVARTRGLEAGLSLLTSTVFALLLRALLLAAVIAGADYGYQRWRHSKGLRMSKQEIKEEHRAQEGDPMLRAQRRARARELSRNRMLADVGSADVVLVNPTELAIALRYEIGAPAPRVVAKGAGAIAARIRLEARRNGVPIRADKPLCRALYRKAKIGNFVPSALFEAVAIVLAWAYRVRGRGPQQAAA